MIKTQGRRNRKGFFQLNRGASVKNTQQFKGEDEYFLRKINKIVPTKAIPHCRGRSRKPTRMNGRSER